MNKLKELIDTFLKKFATKVRECEDGYYVELMMDDHFCIDYDDIPYYIPENNSFYTDDDELLCEMLQCTFPLTHLSKPWKQPNDVVTFTDVDAPEYLDKNGNVIKVGDRVDAPDPDETDVYNFAFRGTVVAFRYECAVVTDQDDDSFDIEANRLELSS